MALRRRENDRMKAPRVCFVELPAADIGAAGSFYAEVFGWALTGFGPSYACTMTGDVDVGLQADMAEAPGAPLPVISVDDLEAMLASVEAAGGVIVKPIFSFPGGRRFHFEDPNGNELAVMQGD
jgi:predicted enzyme related to lactoylglutathione lyase